MLVKLAGDPDRTFQSPRGAVKALLDLLCDEFSEQQSHVKAMVAETAAKILLKFFKSQMSLGKEDKALILDEEKTAMMTSVFNIEKLINNNRLESTLKYQLDIMKAIIGLMKITSGDNMDKALDFLSKLSGAVVAAVTGNGYSDLISLGIDAFSFAYNEIKKKYDENWIIKVLVFDREPTNVNEMQYLI